MRKWRVVGRIYVMKYSWKDHKDRNRHKNRIKRSGQAGLVYGKDINRNIPTTWRWARGDSYDSETNQCSCYGNRQTFTSPSDSVPCLMRMAHARFLSNTMHCPMVTSKSVCPYDSVHSSWELIGAVTKIRCRIIVLFFTFSVACGHRLVYGYARNVIGPL